VLWKGCKRLKGCKNLNYYPLQPSPLQLLQSLARTGYMYIELKEDSALIKSQAVIVLEGNFNI